MKKKKTVLVLMVIKFGFALGFGPDKTPPRPKQPPRQHQGDARRKRPHVAVTGTPDAKIPTVGVAAPSGMNGNGNASITPGCSKLSLEQQAKAQKVLPFYGNPHDWHDYFPKSVISGMLNRFDVTPNTTIPSTRIRELMADRCYILLGDSSMMEQFEDLLHLIGVNRTSIVTKLHSGRIEVGERFEALKGMLDPEVFNTKTHRSTRYVDVESKAFNASIMIRFTGHYNPAMNHLGLPSLLNSDFQDSIKRDADSACGDRDRVLWAESGPHDWSNSLICNYRQYPPLKGWVEKKLPEVCDKTKGANNPLLLADKVPVNVSQVYRDNADKAVSFLETLSPLRIWVSRHHDTGPPHAHFGNVIEDFWRRKIAGLAGWRYADHQMAWICEATPEWQIPTHMNKGPLSYLAAMRAWVALSLSEREIPNPPLPLPSERQQHSAT
mmetsp:Transcript_3387/g.7245  ORF Transcript_3387/g.7245 Transcript_3387/m.7245 type:complete len:438 (+) Transcript_3387:326-1639(+)